MFDTNIFTRILEMDMDLPRKNTHQYFITHIQHDELRATRNKQKRESLLKIFKTITQKSMPTESAIWGVFRWGRAKWGVGKFHHRILKELEKRKPQDKGNVKDALIGETAIVNSIVLVTDDGDLQASVIKLGGQAIDFATFRIVCMHSLR